LYRGAIRWAGLSAEPCDSPKAGSGIARTVLAVAPTVAAWPTIRRNFAREQVMRSPKQSKSQMSESTRPVRRMSRKGMHECRGGNITALVLRMLEDTNKAIIGNIR